MESDKALIFPQIHWPHKHHSNVVFSVRCVPSRPDIHVDQLVHNVSSGKSPDCQNNL